MRILRVAQTLYPDVTGGGAYHVHALSRDQAGMGHDVTVLTTSAEPSQAHIEDRDGYTVVRFESSCSPLGNEISPGVAQYLAAADDYDVIHAHSHLYFSTNLAALQRRLGGVPLAITNHGLYSQTAPVWVFDLYLRTLGRWTFNQADMVLCYTETDTERVREFGVSSPISVVANGIDTDRFTPQGPESELIDHDGPVVLFVGRLVEGKRPGDAVDAVKELDDDVALYLCGDGPLREELEAQAGEWCTFLGQVSYEEMPGVYRAADLLVVPSRAEGMPRTVLEALSSGVPVVSSDLDQIRSSFGDTVTYIECGDVMDLADKITARLGEGQEPRLEDRFHWDRTVKETTTVLEDIVEENR